MSKKKAKPPKKIQHRIFALNYLETFDRIDSYMKAYNCSRQNAYSNSSRVFNRKDVQDYINSMIEESIEENYSVARDPGIFYAELTKMALGNYSPTVKMNAIRMLQETGIFNQQTDESEDEGENKE